ncbi:hypothetical protein A8144_04030 [Mycobacterium leprae 3125609]|nr:hypothetical protein A8144_04030 [Mycobacterium leprae 3125609]OAX71933.1 hypothetical protein A3216_03065 [Mycobacterium leprae 7935681]
MLLAWVIDTDSQPNLTAAARAATTTNVVQTGLTKNVTIKLDGAQMQFSGRQQTVRIRVSRNTANRDR